MNNLLSYCGLVDLRINASEKDLPVCISYGMKLHNCHICTYTLLASATNNPLQKKNVCRYPPPLAEIHLFYSKML